MMFKQVLFNDFTTKASMIKHGNSAYSHSLYSVYLLDIQKAAVPWKWSITLEGNEKEYPM